MKYQLLIFDWDGTLMDSAERIINCYTKAAVDLGLPKPDPFQIEQYIGISLYDAYGRLFPEVDKATLEELVARYREYWLFVDQTPMALFEGVEEGLRYLTAQGGWLAVATGKSRAGLNRVFEDYDFQSLFLYTRCADESRSKPHPQMLLDILDYAGVESNEAVMIGDTTFDMEMALAAGIDRVGVSYGSHSRAKLSEFECQHIADGFGEVVQFLS